MRVLIGIGAAVLVAVGLGALDFVLYGDSPSGVLSADNPLMAVSRPVARILAWITGSSLMDETAILIYLAAMVLTLLVVGAVAGIATGSLLGVRAPTHRTPRDP